MQDAKRVRLSIVQHKSPRPWQLWLLPSILASQQGPRPVRSRQADLTGPHQEELYVTCRQMSKAHAPCAGRWPRVTHGQRPQPVASATAIGIPVRPKQTRPRGWQTASGWAAHTRLSCRRYGRRRLGWLGRNKLDVHLANVHFRRRANGVYDHCVVSSSRLPARRSHALRQGSRGSRSSTKFLIVRADQRPGGRFRASAKIRHRRVTARQRCTDRHLPGHCLLCEASFLPGQLCFS